MTRLILIDVDGVLADYDTPAFALVKEVTGLTLSRDDLQAWDLYKDPRIVPYSNHLWKRTEEKGWIRNLIPAHGAKEAVEDLRKLGEVHVLTSSVDAPFYHSERLAWLKEHFSFDRKEVTFSHAKWNVAGDVFIDDRPSNVEQWNEKAGRGKTGILWRPMERVKTPIIDRASTWPELLDCVVTSLSLIED